MPHPPGARLAAMRHFGVVLLLVLLAPVASAHAVLESAEPGPNEHADEGLDVVLIRFTEGVEREYTDGDVLDQNGTSWKSGPIEFDASENNVIRVPVRPLGSGLYSVSWKALSVDTHTTRGTFVIAIGSAALRPGQYEPIVDAPAEADVLRDGFARFAFYVGLFLAAGMPLFALIVVREPPPRSLFTSATAFGLVGAAGAFVGLLFLGDRTGLGLGAVSTAPGRSFLFRGILVALAAMAGALAVIRPALWRSASWAAVAFGLGAILATATGSHAASVRENALVFLAADVAHLIAAAVWVGGIVAFLHALWGRGALETSQLVFRFGTLAVPSVAILLATGFLASWVHMPCSSAPLSCIDALWTERYMQLVTLKLSLMGPLILLGAYNKYRVGPRLARGEWTPQRFRKVVQVEAALMALIVGAAGVLAATAPPAQEVVSTAPPSPMFELTNTTEKSHVILQVSPNPVTVGVQKLVVIVHPLGPTLPNGTLVAIKVWHESEEEPELTTVLEKATPNEWEVEDGLFTSAGTWNVLVILQRPDEFVRIPFQVPVVDPPTTSS